MLFIEAAEYFAPENKINIINFADAIGISPAQARVYQRIYGIEQIPVVQQMSIIKLIKQAIQSLLAQKKVSRGKIKFLIHAHTSQVMSPVGQAVIRQVQRELKFNGTIAFGISMNKCASTLSAFEMADYLLRDEAEDARALIVAGDIAFTPALRFIPGTAIVGDAAAVVLVSKIGAKNKLLSVVTNVHGEYSKGLWMTAAESAQFEAAYLRLLAQTIQQALYKADITLADLKIILPHNVNIPSWEKVAKQLQIAADKIYLNNVKKFSHCFGADVLINYLSAQHDALFKPGDYFLMAAVGLGATFAAAVFRH